MLNNVHIKNLNNGVDLTSLLDVIFILLMVVMLNQKELTGKTEDAIGYYGQCAAGAQAANDNLNGMSEDINNFEKIVEILQISVPYVSDNPEIRVIKVLSLDEVKKEQKEQKEFNLEGNEEKTKEEWAKFESFIRKYIEEKNISEQNSTNDEIDDEMKDLKPIIIRINGDDESTLYRDQLKMNEIMVELKKEYGNIYLN